MPGTLIFKPVKANLTRNDDSFMKMTPYCTVMLGDQEINGKTANSGGKCPHWDDSIVVKKNFEPYCILKIKGKEWFKTDSTVGHVEIDLREIEEQGRVTKWYKVSHDSQPAGEILIESSFMQDTCGNLKQMAFQQNYNPSTDKEYYTQNVYPSNIYSPAKQFASGHRHISQMPTSQIPGLDYSHQVTYPHISHNLSQDEYYKMHSRQNERYQPTQRVVGKPETPPSWPGFESMISYESQSPKKYEGSLESTAGGTPDRFRTTARPSASPLQENLSYYPSLGGVSYGPVKGGQGYKPIYEEPSYTNMQKNQRKLSTNSDVLESAKNIAPLQSTSINTL